MGHEADGGLAFQTGRGGQTGDEVAVVVDGNVGDAEFLELALEEPGDVPLGLGRRDFLYMAIALGIHLRVAEEALDHSLGVGLGEQVCIVFHGL